VSAAIKIPAEENLRETQQFRSQMGHISRQSGVFFAGTLFTAVAGYLFKVYLARVLGAEALGIYALGMTVVGLAGVFGGFGLTWAASRFPAVYATTGRMEELRSFVTWSVVFLIIINGLIAGGVIAARHWIAVKAYHTPALAGYLDLFAAILFIGALTTFFGQMLTGYKQVARRTMITNFTGSLLMMFLTVLLVTRGAGLRGYILAQVAASLVTLVWLMWTARRLTPVPARVAMRPIRYPQMEMFSFAAAAFAMDIMAFLSGQTDKVILGFYLNARAVGIYAVAAAITTFVIITLQSVNQIFSPTIAELHARGEMDLLNRLFQSLTKWITAITLPLAMVVIIFSPVMMRIFGRDFEAGWIILVIGTSAQLINCGTGSVGYLLLMSGNERRVARIQLVTALVAVAGCLLFVPVAGIAGAAIAGFFASLVNNLWCLLEVKRVLKLFPYNRTYWRLVLPTSVTLAVTIALRLVSRSLRPDAVILIVVTIVVYAVFAGLALGAGLDADDRLITEAVWSRVQSFLPGR
jgi:O-antigen/teichoic acid export membrane protein